MSNHSLTESDANNLVDLKKIVSAKLGWKREHRGWRLKVKAVAISEEQIFEIAAYIGRSNYSFTLLYRGNVLRKFTKHAGHRIGGTVYHEPHKHVWDGETENAKAYIPSDINPNDDINDQFLSFCNECNVEIAGGYQRVAYQLQ